MATDMAQLRADVATALFQLGPLGRMPSTELVEAVERLQKFSDGEGESFVKPSIVGRDRVLVDKAVRWILKAVAVRAEHTAVTELRRGSTFCLKVGADGEEARHVVRVTVELDRIEES